LAAAEAMPISRLVSKLYNDKAKACENAFAADANG
jgi:hypothetical protein